MVQSDRLDRNALVPVSVITGFLGSGKTTVLNRLLLAPDLADTVVIINEFGEVSLDHLLIEQAIENAVLLKNGCICCTVRGDILDTIGELFRKRATGELPWFRRIAIETTGLADPAPVVQTLTDADQPCHLDGIVVTVDAIHGRKQLRQQPEARNQVAFADRILLTKTDLVAPAEADAMEAAIRAFNSGAPIRRVVDGDVTPEDVFGIGPQREPTAWLGPAGPSRRPDHHGTHPRDHGHVHTHEDHHARTHEDHHARTHEDHHAHTHDDDAHHHDGIGSILLCTEHPIAGPALALWLDSLLSVHGADVLRLKGIVRIAGVAQPIVLQAVHHVLHRMVALPPAAEAAWGGAGCEIVVIHRGLPEAGLRTSFATATASTA
jgi:G3E family GTPase